MIEVLLAVVVVAVVGAIGVPVYHAMQVRNELDINATTIAQSMRRAQVLSQTADTDSTWGVSVQSGSITLFQGSSFANRNTGYDETFDLAISITPSGISEVVFAKLTGDPQTTGTITLTSNTNETRTITINEKGMVSY